MAPKSFLLTDSVDSYLSAHNPPPDPVVQSLVAATTALGQPARMQIAPEQGALMTFLARMLRVRFAVEVGTFTGYSALCVARGMEAGGRLLCCDINEEWTSIARRHWDMAGVADRVELRLGPAIDTLRSLPRTPSIDLAFIDADKTGYRDYYEELLPRLSDAGMIMVDNVLWSGAVIDSGHDDPDTSALRAFNDAVAADPRSESVMLPLADGVTFIRRA